MRQVSAIGGGGFGRTQDSTLIEQFILDQTSKKNPKICFIPTATGDLDPYIVNYYSVFSRLNCEPTHISFFKRTIDLEEHILKQDAIFVGGGNTKSMLAVWRDWGLDLILKKAYD
jgi:aminopeptidase N